MSIHLISELAPKNNGQFALLDDMYLRGGFHICENLTVRNTIPVDRRKWGMKVFVQSTDTVYSLDQDLSTWSIDSGLTRSLQDAYNCGSTIKASPGIPISLSGSDFLSRIFEIKTADNQDIVAISGDNKVEFFNQLQGKEYTSSINSTIVTNSVGTILDRTEKAKYRAIQYFYTVSNSDNSGFETGQLHVIHNGFSATISVIIGNAIGIPCGMSFSVNISGHDILLIADTDNSGMFSRIVHLFKVALT